MNYMNYMIKNINKLLLSVPILLFSVLTQANNTSLKNLPVDITEQNLVNNETSFENLLKFAADSPKLKNQLKKPTVWEKIELTLKDIPDFYKLCKSDEYADLNIAKYIEHLNINLYDNNSISQANIPMSFFNNFTKLKSLTIISDGEDDYTSSNSLNVRNMVRNYLPMLRSVISNNINTLESLELKGYMDNNFTAELKKLTGLQSLVLGWRDHIDEIYLDFPFSSIFKHNRSLKTLKVHGASFSNLTENDVKDVHLNVLDVYVKNSRVINTLIKNSSLKDLRLSGRDAELNSLPALTTVRSLESLDITVNEDRTVSLVAKILENNLNIKRLEVTLKTNLTSNLESALSKLNKLENLNIHASKMTSEDIRNILDLYPHLKKLNLDYSNVDVTIVMPLKKMDQLEDLSMKISNYSQFTSQQASLVLKQLLEMKLKEADLDLKIKFSNAQDKLEFDKFIDTLPSNITFKYKRTY